MFLRSVLLSQVRFYNGATDCVAAVSRRTVHLGRFSPLLQRRFASSTTAASSSAMASGDASNGVASSIVAERTDDIIKSPLDTRQYRGLVLSNGLRALLVSDAGADKAAAAMSVMAGHLSDPWEIPGVAHFCEHMLFLGTEKYESENEYNVFLAANAGGSNAYTASDHTVYHFDVKPDALEGALDRFVQFFLSPQFTESATEREVNAVNSEHSKNLNNDGWRQIQIERYLAKDGHDYRKFGTGDKGTLKDTPLKMGLEPRKALLDFHNKFYSSNIMAFSVVGKESLDELEGMVSRLGFGDIKNKNVTPTTWDQAYGPEQCGRIVEIVPVKDSRTLAIKFPMPDLKAEYKSDSVGYLTHIMGHEGKGSLLSRLRSLGWVSSLSAGYGRTATGFGAYQIHVDLSLSGLDHVDGIIEEVFNTVAMLKHAGPQEWVFDEMRRLKNIEFIYKDKEKPDALATDACNELQHYPVKEIRSWHYHLDKFNPERVTELLGYLRPDNMWAKAVSQTFANLPDLTTEPIYGTSMRVRKFSPDLMNRFTTAMNSPSPPKYIHMPERNEYITEALDLKEREADCLYPSLIRDEKWSRVWFKQDDEYKMPKLVVNIAVSCPMASVDPRAAILGSLTFSCLEDSLTEVVYSAELAGLKKAIQADDRGFNIMAYGFDEKLPQFLHDLVARIIAFKPDEQKFDILKEKLLRTLRNFEKSQPYSLGHHQQSVILQERIWSQEQMLAVAKDLTFADVAGHLSSLLSAFHVEMLVHGNVTKKEALAMADDAVAQLRSMTGTARPLFANECKVSRELDLGCGSNFVSRKMQRTHDDASAQVILQLGQRSLRNAVMLQLLIQVLHEPAFNVLRTEETLGYIVATWPQRSSTGLAMAIIVQGLHEPDFIEERIEAFIERAGEIIDKMTEEEFAKHIEAIISKLEEKPKTLTGMFNRYWDQIHRRHYNFNKRVEEVAELRRLTKNDLVDFYLSHVHKDGPQRRKLSMLVHGSKDKTTELEGQRKTRAEKKAAAGVVEEEIIWIDAVRDRLTFFGHPRPAIDLPPIGTPSVTIDACDANHCTTNGSNGTKANGDHKA